MTSALLPRNSTKWEKALADAMSPAAHLISGINSMRRFKLIAPRANMLPFLVWEYGLGELTPYVPNLYTLIDEGVRWQRLRGTVSAIAMGLAWIGYTATLEEAWTGRKFWNSFQLRFPTLPLNDDPDLERIEGITKLSIPLRSNLRRGVHYYDVNPLEANMSRLNDSLLDFESGVTLNPGGTVWSFGRPQEFDHLLTEAEGMAMGNWLEDAGETLWVDVNIPWVDADFLWADAPEVVRRSIMANWFVGKTLWARLKQANGDIIGYRRARAVRPIRATSAGPYKMGSTFYEPSGQATALYVEALTQFDDASGVTCSEISLIVNGALAGGIKPGRLWLEPGQLIGGQAFATKVVSIPLRRTVREQLKFLVRF